jgi:hypothetical protein
MNWVYCVATVLLGVCFYWLRERRRLLYGVTELFVGILLIYLTPHSPDGTVFCGVIGRIIV